ncbi:MAG TPA: glutathione peroxidase [Lentimicrobium sp.]|nr:glutathione peroxidase [Lentimicrobium sp.]
MKRLILIGFIIMSGIIIANAQKSFYDFKVKAIDGKEFDLSSLKGKKVMVVNTASQCGNTPQYKKLEALYEKYKDHNFMIIGFPANNFGSQEPGTNEEIAEFCEVNYGITFPMMEKISVKGDDQHPLYAWLTKASLNGKMDSEVKWNFQKFLINESGQLVDVIEPRTQPDSEKIINWIEGKNENL